MAATFSATHLFQGVAPLALEFTRIAKIKCETLRTDPDIFDVWAEFVTASERLAALVPALGPAADESTRQLATDGLLAVCIQHEMDHLEGKLFVDYLSPLKREMVRKKLVKQRRESAAVYTESGRPELAENELAEAAELEIKGPLFQM